MLQRVVAAIQTRLGSTRLKEKALRNLAGEPLLKQVINQVGRSELISEVGLMTSSEGLDDRLVQYTSSIGIRSSRGLSDDIVGRLLNHARTFDADLIVRVWGDCPFVCPDLIDRMILECRSKALDFMTNGDIERSAYPPGLGVEIYSRAIIERMNIELTESRQREFPIEFIRAHVPADKRSHFLDGGEYWKSFPGLQLTIDYEQDLAAAELILTELHAKNSSFQHTDLVSLHKLQPDLFLNFSTQPRNVEYKQYRSVLKGE
jgi:spore coat polysaccharide biosynthesis protein SpsF (cytidylyltransferase family)